MQKTFAAPSGCPHLAWLAALAAHAQGTTADSVLSRSRAQEDIHARFAVMRALRRRRGLTLGQIALRFGFDHTTVINGLKRAEALKAQSPTFAALAAQLEAAA